MNPFFKICSSLLLGTMMIPAHSRPVDSVVSADRTGHATISQTIHRLSRQVIQSIFQTEHCGITSDTLSVYIPADSWPTPVKLNHVSGNAPRKTDGATTPVIQPAASRQQATTPYQKGRLSNQVAQSVPAPETTPEDPTSTSPGNSSGTPVLTSCTLHADRDSLAASGIANIICTLFHPAGYELPQKESIELPGHFTDAVQHFFSRHPNITEKEFTIAIYIPDALFSKTSPPVPSRMNRTLRPARRNNAGQKTFSPDPRVPHVEHDDDERPGNTHSVTHRDSAGASGSHPGTFSHRTEDFHSDDTADFDVTHSETQFEPGGNDDPEINTGIDPLPEKSFDHLTTNTGTGITEVPSPDEDPFAPSSAAPSSLKNTGFLTSNETEFQNSDQYISEFESTINSLRADVPLGALSAGIREENEAAAGADTLEETFDGIAEELR